MIFFCQRIHHNLKKRGLIGTLKRIPLKIWHILFRRREFLYYVDLLHLPEGQSLPENCTIRRYKCIGEIDQLDIEVLVRYCGKYLVERQMPGRFENASSLWVIRSDEKAVGMLWTIMGKTICSHYSYLTSNDIHFYNDEIFEDYRGRGLNTVLLNYVLEEVKKEGAVRAYIETNLRNSAQVRSLKKNPFERFAVASKICIFGMVIVIWSKDRK